MKKYGILAMALVMVAALLTGCGCTNNAMDTQPATKPATMPTTMPTTEASRPTQTAPSTEKATMPSNPMDNANTSATGASEPSNTGTTETTEPMTRQSGRVRSHVNGDF